MMKADFVNLGKWLMRFERGETDARREAGEWMGKTLADFARERLAQDPEAIAIIGEKQQYSFRQLHDDAAALARGLLGLGLQPGDTVSLQLPNWVETATIDLACAMGGFVINPIIPIYRHHELSFILQDCQARAIFIPESFRNVDFPQMLSEVRSALPALEHVVLVRGDGDDVNGYQRLLESGRRSSAVLPAVDPDSPKMIIYTSGTTGHPKGVIYSHNQATRPFAVSHRVWEMPVAAKFLMPSPVTHITGFLYGLEAIFSFDTRTVLMERWDAAKAVFFF